MQALERIDEQYQYKYMYVKCIVEQCMEEAEAGASPPEAVEAEFPSDFTWAMSLGVGADKANMFEFKAADILHLASRQLAQGTNVQSYENCSSFLTKCTRIAAQGAEVSVTTPLMFAM